MTTNKSEEISEILASTAPLLTAAQAAPLLGCSPASLRLAMRDHPEWLPPGTVVRTSATRCRIVRVALLQALGLYPGASPPDDHRAEKTMDADAATPTSSNTPLQ